MTPQVWPLRVGVTNLITQHFHKAGSSIAKKTVSLAIWPDSPPVARHFLDPTTASGGQLFPAARRYVQPTVTSGVLLLPAISRRNEGIEHGESAAIGRLGEFITKHGNLIGRGNQLVCVVQLEFDGCENVDDLRQLRTKL